MAGLDIEYICTCGRLSQLGSSLKSGTAPDPKGAQRETFFVANSPLYVLQV